MKSLGLAVSLAILAAWPAEARIERSPAAPGTGGPHTAFVYRYDSPGTDANTGDQLYLYGPRGTRCRGLIAQGPTGFETGVQTVVFDHRRPTSSHRRFFRFRPVRFRDDREIPLRRWCRGYYHGQVRFVGDSVDSLQERFFFMVR